MQDNYNNPKRKKKLLNQRRHDFLLTFFTPEPIYQVEEINGYVLVKQFNKASDRWEVAIHTKEGWKKVQDWKENQTTLV